MPDTDPNYDIANWTCGRSRFYEDVLKKEKRQTAGSIRPGSGIVRLPRVQPHFAYALFADFISARPNGMFTFLGLMEGTLPVDNMVWWDFLLAKDGYLLNVLSGVNGMECLAYSKPDKFDVTRFILENTQRYSDRVRSRLSSYEVHEVYTNHYRSYRTSIEWLKKEIETLDVTVPPFQGGLTMSKVDFETSRAALDKFGDNSLRFHVLAKSLLVNAAFTCEALVNTLIRIGSLYHIRRDAKREDVLRPILRASMSVRISTLHAYTDVFSIPVDIAHPVIRRVLDLMHVRNKYVHAEVSDENRWPDIYFDDLIPLYGGGPHGQIVETMRRANLDLKKEDVMQAVTTADDLEKHLLGLMHKKARPGIEMILSLPQLTFNKKKGVYSVVYPRQTFQSVFSVDMERAAEPSLSVDTESTVEPSLSVDDAPEIPTSNEPHLDPPDGE
jgi:hypothetical protein